MVRSVMNHVNNDRYLVGACGNCRMSTMTFKAGVEAAIRRDVPEVKSIEVVNLTPLTQ